jgi:hypothetical protein
VGACMGPISPDPAYCFMVPCDPDAECPAEGRCVNASGAYGITWNETCATGSCQR